MFLGIEIGGTKLQIGLGAGDGTLVELRRCAVAPDRGSAGILKQIADLAPQLLQASPQPVRAIGVGFGGPVDDRAGICLKSHQITGWEEFPLARWLQEQFGLPAVVGNDADLAGLAEAHYGAGVGCDPVFYVTVGSGIGGALIHQGKVFRGVGLGAGEIGHMWIEADLNAWDRTNRTAWRNLEDGSSGWAIQRQAGLPSVQAVAEAMSQGDAAAAAVWRHARRRLALALSHVVALLCPQRIVIGGGVSLLGDELFFSPLREELRQIAFPPFAGCWDIQPAALGEAVVVHGALAFARQLEV